MNGNADVAVKFLSAAEVTFAQLAKTPSIGKVTQLPISRLGKSDNGASKILRVIRFSGIQDATVEIL